jgi:phosphoribosylglycinamide formyltransferase-1
VRDPFRIAVLVSGAGTNLQALIDEPPADPATQRPIEVVAVASSRADAGALGRAERAGIETAVFAMGGEAAGGVRATGAAPGDARATRDVALGDWLERRRVELVVLAGWMELLGPGFIRRFAGRIINVHPSLLPAFPGLRAVEQAVEYGVKVTGATVHFVDEGVDSGAIILQEGLELPYPARITEIEQRLHGVEHRLLPRVVRLIAEERVRLDPANPRVVLIDDVD